jgi:hypothetical protein
LNFQTMVADLTGLPVANASLLDEATACAEAMVMAERVAKSKARGFFVDENCHPQNIAVMRTRAEPLGIEVIVGPPEDARPCSGVRRDLPVSGHLRASARFPDAIAALHTEKAVAIVATDLLALTLIKEPGAMDADIAVGSAQRFGVPLGYGGPHAAFIACRDAMKRAMPGRIVGVSVDSHGHKAYRLSLQTREQHIRREKATSNVCTAQALLAVMASFYAVFHGPVGLRAIAERVHSKAARLGAALRPAGSSPRPGLFRHDHRAGGRAAVADHGRRRRARHQPARRGRGPDRDFRRRDHDRGGPRGRLPRLRHPQADRRRCCPRSPTRSVRVGVPDASDLPHEPRRKRDDALHAAAVGPGPGARPGDDPAGVLHDEAERLGRDDADHLARVQFDPPLRARRPGRGLCRDDRGPDGAALRDHRL